jgi:hypothetical protein
MSRETNAIVTVVCATSQFVSIEPQPGSPFLGTNGGAYRFMLESSGLMPPDDPLWAVGTGTITTMHIYHNNKGKDDTIDMLVSF